MPDQAPMTEAMYYILLSLLKPGHGYGMMQRVKELSGGRLEMGPGTLYGVLARMNREGLIAFTGEEGRRKNYAITPAGRSALLAEYARQRRACTLVKGLRAVSDYENELQMALINRKINPRLETMFLPSSAKYTYVSSSVVKEMARYGADLSDFLPREIIADVNEKVNGRREH